MTREASSSARRGRGLIAAAIAALVLVGAIVGVAIWRARGSGSSAAPAQSPTASPSAAATGPEQQASQQALAAYNGYSEAYIAATATADYNNKDLPKYAADPLLAETRLALQMQGRQGIVNQGRPTWSVRVTKVNVSTRPYSVTLEDCFDQTNWKSVYKATGESAAAPDQAQRYIINSTAWRYDDGRWLITESKADRSRPC